MEKLEFTQEELDAYVQEKLEASKPVSTNASSPPACDWVLREGKWICIQDIGG